MHPFYLIYSLFYFFPLLFMGEWLDQQSGLWWFSMVFLYAAFVGAYLLTGSADLRLRFGSLILMLVLGVLGVNISVGTSSFFAYLPFCALLMLPTRQAWMWMAASVVALAIATWLSGFVWYFWAPAAGVFTLNTIVALMELQRRKLQQTSDRASKLAERERIARNLHDVTGHQLTAIALKAQLAQKLIEKGRYEQAQSELVAVAELAAQNRAAIRGAIEDEWPSDVAEAYGRLLALLRSQGFECTVSGEMPNFTARARPEVTAIVTEAMTNALRHASDPKLTASHQFEAGHYIWTLSNPASHSASPSGLGLKSMRQRAETLDGEFSFEVDQAGTAQLRLSLPLNCLASE